MPEVLALALEHIPAASFVVSARGRILVVNRIGSMWLAADRARASALARRGGPDPARFDVSAFASGATTSYLAVLMAPPAHVAPLQVSAARWCLTRRETEVVAGILRGATNRRIADELSCSMKTVEHHVSSILRKADVENRAGLILAILEA